MALPNVNTGDGHVAAHNNERAEIARVEGLVGKISSHSHIVGPLSAAPLGRTWATAAESSADYPPTGNHIMLETYDSGGVRHQVASEIGDDGQWVRHNVGGWQPWVNRVQQLLGYAYGEITDLNNAPFGASLAYNGSQNRPPGFSHCLVETHQVPFGIYQRATNMFTDGTGIAVRGFYNGAWTAWRNYNEYDVTRKLIEDIFTPRLHNVSRSNKLVGGGLLHSDAAGIAWEGRFMIITHGYGVPGKSGLLANFQQMTMPADGTVIPGVGGAPDVTVSNFRIPFEDWKSLYYITEPNETNSKAANYRLVGYNTPSEVPDHWILIAQAYPDFQQVIWATGVIQTPVPGGMHNPQAMDVVGTGAPSHGAYPGAVYTDRNKTNGAVKWINVGDGFNWDWRVTYGSTGWRDFSYFLRPMHPQNTGRVIGRRFGQTVTFAFENLRIPTYVDGSVSYDILANIPEGFTANTYFTDRVTRSNNGGAFNEVFLNGPNLTWISEMLGGQLQSARPDVGIQGQISFQTDKPWPSLDNLPYA